MNNKHEEEGLLQGLLLLPKLKEDTKSPNYKRYKFLKCNHEALLQPQHVRRGNIACKECFELTLKEDAINAGYELLGNAKGDHGKHSIYFRRYKNLNCGCESDIRYNAMKNKITTSCSICYEKSLKEEAEKRDLRYIGVSDRGGAYRKFQYKQCLHFQDIHAACIFRGAFECKICIEEGTKQEAKDAGLVLLDKECIAGSGYRSYLLPCGCIRDLRIANVRQGVWACKEHGQTHLVHESYIYLLEINTENYKWLKLGFSRNVENRIVMYGIKTKSEILTLFKVKLKSGYDALDIEKKLHTKFKNFKLDPTRMKIYMNNGHTECYPVELKDRLIKELEDIFE